MIIIKLVKKAQKGDDKAFIKLFQQYEEDIYRMAYVYVKNESDALDVVQEVAYRSFKKIETLKNPEYFKTWLIKIAITCSIDLVRKNKKVIQLKTEYDECNSFEGEDIPLSITLQELLDQLNEDEKSIVILKFYEGYSFKEIADLLNMPIGSAKSVLYRALGKLRKQFKEADLS
ncbi:MULTISPECIES: sigma-70 family RNA polymerase sigma factor [Peribacillus]|uniref:sigma-70 family RNA polymerase sigma factor n=1 Tax=Peribacillus TaxID=2675229 RepID=UPI0010714132|nr:sigma-70 family RNA polymerase sigma factor [Peribacillus frigoritolerans]MEC0347790.1 sigma-70 family RNA polymerase sigma factor [Peribacillus castrilensis]TFH58184.1 sigma-70 family RNA polymerase sigma factor [Peribacillus frigoritolerans]